LIELTNWRQLSDRGPDLVPCLDFPGGRAAAGFAELAAGVPVEACFLHFRQAGAGPLAACVDRWVDELVATGRPVRAVLGYCAGTALATRVADAIAATGPPPMVVLFDAVPTTGGSLASQFASAVESNAKHLTADELADAHGLSEQLVEAYPDDLPRIAAALIDRYERLILAVAGRLSVHESLRQELIGTFTAYMDYLLLASEGGFDMRTTTPLFLSSTSYEPPVEGARTIALDIGHDDLLRAPHVHELVTDLLTGEHPW
jgi:thioesterase domain-containing protein